MDEVEVGKERRSVNKCGIHNGTDNGEDGIAPSHKPVTGNKNRNVHNKVARADGKARSVINHDGNTADAATQ